GKVFDALDLLVNNAGIGAARSPHRAALADLGSLERARMIEMLNVNAVSPILVTQALRDLLIAAGGAKVLVVSSNIGSLGLKASGGRHASGRYAYGASKAALNYMTIGLANDLAKDGVIAVAIHPGYVRTDMGGPDATEAVDESVARMLAIIDRVTPADSGAFFNYTGERLPY
ncbi:MAG: SDR family NAD(P)-dependent oxidoreductase, partial [Dehalococcoidia bacterium]|nr:SDR family NAD(P)-dependent oxidoreductase [Dehalococcoidia bacterium]